MNGKDYINKLTELSSIYTFSKEEEEVILSGDICGTEEILSKKCKCGENKGTNTQNCSYCKEYAEEEATLGEFVK